MVVTLENVTARREKACSTSQPRWAIQRSQPSCWTSAASPTPTCPHAVPHASWLTSTSQTPTTARLCRWQQKKVSAAAAAISDFSGFCKPWFTSTLLLLLSQSSLLFQTIVYKYSGKQFVAFWPVWSKASKMIWDMVTPFRCCCCSVPYLNTLGVTQHIYAVACWQMHSTGWEECMCDFCFFITPPSGQPQAIFGGFISISGGWMLLWGNKKTIRIMIMALLHITMPLFPFMVCAFVQVTARLWSCCFSMGQPQPCWMLVVSSSPARSSRVCACRLSLTESSTRRRSSPSSQTGPKRLLNSCGKSGWWDCSRTPHGWHAPAVGWGEKGLDRDMVWGQWFEVWLWYGLKVGVTWKLCAVWCVQMVSRFYWRLVVLLLFYCCLFFLFFLLADETAVELCVGDLLQQSVKKKWWIAKDGKSMINFIIGTLPEMFLVPIS